MDQKQSGDVIIVYGSMQPRPSAMKYIRLLMSGQLKIIYALTCIFLTKGTLKNLNIIYVL